MEIHWVYAYGFQLSFSGKIKRNTNTKPKKCTNILNNINPDSISIKLSDDYTRGILVGYWILYKTKKKMIKIGPILSKI